MVNMEDEKETLQFEDQEMIVPLDHLEGFSPGGNPKLILSEWSQKLESKTLDVVDFKDHWRKFVPKYYSLAPGSADWSLDGDKADDDLIQVLEIFIANGNFEEEVRKLKEADKPPSVCGRVFKMGEPTYSCRECGMDSTCVLCVGCFKQSPHRNHNYKMGTSIGGGFCDCGDTEAWRTGPYCDIHLAGTQVAEDRASVMPPEMASRCEIAFTSVLRYSYQILTLQHSPRLPHDLRPVENELGMDSDVYCTVLYNDEIHTFEQVINTLTKIVKCTQKDSIDYVTNIDREGRAVVKCGMFQQCQELKTEIERFTARHGGQPLRVDVVHTHVIAHQVFAMRLLRWLQQILMNSESFRNLFTEVALKVALPQTSIVEGILLRDSVLWKSARTHWHRLFISGMLMEYANKKSLAKIFTKNYGTVMKDFIRDDHDHSFSIASLSVQIFTVPTLALHLIAHEEVLFVLLNTFLSECSSKLNRDSKLQFERNGPSNAFKRAQYILYDLRYLLSTVPSREQWTDALRRGFLQGLQLFLKLMLYMEGMDAATRQTVQHMEFEPEWESAFNLHIKLAHVITMLVEWCGSDKIVLIKAFRVTHRDLAEPDRNVTYVLRELANHSASCIQYDVALQQVSIHLPLSRFFAGLYLHLDKFGLTFDSPEIQSAVRPLPVQLMEPILKTQVMIGQVHAGMWRRNGYSILNQLYFYHNVRCRSEMLDRDITMMQIGASLIESDEFLIHVINKFGLMQWADPNYEENAEEESMRQTISLAEEMLGLLVTIIGERFVPGVGLVTPDDKISKEIMQQLCIKPMSHSELNKTLPDDANHETGLERVIDKVAVFKKPENTGKGVYELKPELYEQYNIYFYHYTREELSKSEEAQRRRRKAAGLLECCPPPMLPPLAPPFESLPNLLQCDVMMHILETVLSRALNLRARSYSEQQLQKALHLIGFALQEEQSQRYPYLRFADKSVKWEIEKLVTELGKSPRVESHKDMLLWVSERFKAMKEETVVHVSQPAADKDIKEWRAKMAAEKRAKIMAQMAAMQKSFMAGNAHLLGAMDCEGNGNGEGEEEPPAVHTCILCQQDTAVTADGSALVLSALVQRSTVHISSPKKFDLDKTDEVFSKPFFRPTKLRPQIHTSTCGHVMHSHCWQAHFDNVLARESRRPYRMRPPTSFDIEKQEFLCPLCECLGNTVIPLLPPLPSSSTANLQLSVEKFLKYLLAILENKSKNGDDTTTFHVSSLVEVAELEEGSALAEAFTPAPPPKLSSSLTEMISHFADSTYTRGLNVIPSYNSFIPMMAWNTVYYTAHSTAALLEDEDKAILSSLPMRDKSCIEGLARFGAWLPAVWSKPQDISDQALQLLITLMDESSAACLQDWDTFGLLVPLALSLPSLFGPAIPSDGIIQRHLALFFFYADITRAFIFSSKEDDECDMETEETDPESVSEALNMLKNKCGCELESNHSRLWPKIKRSCLPFLRRAALFYHYLYSRTSGGELEERGGDTFENLCRYLKVPSSPDELLRAPEFIRLAGEWAKHPRIGGYISSSTLIRPRGAPTLEHLPTDYSELINMVSTFTCPNSDRDDSRNPTMCLVCGEMLCSQSYCCQQELNKSSVGACTYHAHRCGAGVGIFLRVRECEVLMLATRSRGCFLSAPYLDRYGETDQGLRRGNPLTLCPQRYRRLKRLWLGHHLYEEIARAVEGSTNLMTTPWQHL